MQNEIMIWTNSNSSRIITLFTAEKFYQKYKYWQSRELSYSVDFHLLLQSDAYVQFKINHTMEKDDQGKSITTLSNEELVNYILLSDM